MIEQLEVTTRKTQKIRRVASGIVFERSPLDARAIEASAPDEYVLVGAAVPSIRDIVSAMARSEIEGLLATVPERHSDATAHSFLVERLVTLVEAGQVQIPEAA